MWVLPKNILKRSNWAAGVQHVPYGHCTKLVFSLFIPVVHKKSSLRILSPWKCLSGQMLFQPFFTYQTSSLNSKWLLRLLKICFSKFWFDSEQKSWILKKFYVSSSAGNLGSHWIMGLKIKSYYQILARWWKLDHEKAELFSKNWEFI